MRSGLRPEPSTSHSYLVESTRLVWSYASAALKSQDLNEHLMRCRPQQPETDRPGHYRCPRSISTVMRRKLRGSVANKNYLQLLVFSPSITLLTERQEHITAII